MNRSIGYIVLIQLLFGPIFCLAQTTFNNRYGEINVVDSTIYSFNTCRSISIFDSIILATQQELWDGQDIRLGCIGLNYSGDTLFNTYFGSENSWWYLGNTSSSFKTSDGYSIEVGVRDQIGTILMQPSMYKFDQSGDTVWTKEYNILPERVAFGQQVIETANGDYVMVARAITDTINWDPQILVIRTDSDGNLLWHQEYGDPDSIEEYGVSIVEISDGFLIGGQYFGSPFSNNFVLKIDDLGNQQWLEQYGSPDYDDGSTQLTYLSDGTCLMSGTVGVDDDLFHATLRKISTNGDVIWEYQYGAITSLSTFLSVIEDWDNNIIAVGEKLDSTGWRIGTMIRTDSDGDSLWMREYRLFETNTVHHLLDVGIASDNSYVAAGWEITLPPNPHVGQDVWIFKVDEHGCIEPGCHLIDGLTSINIGLQNTMQAFPNPVKDNLTIRFNLPPSGSFGNQKNNRLITIDQMGRIVKEQPLNQFQNQSSFNLDIDFSDVSAGLYTLHWVSQNGWLDSTKIVKE